MSARSGTLSRLGIRAQVLVTVLLAVAAVVMLNWLGGRPGVRVRKDLTAAGQNTLSAATHSVLDSLRAPVEVDVFYRPEEPPLSALAADVMSRTYQLLILMDQEAGDDFKVRNNDVSDRQAFAERARELRLAGYENCLIVHQEGRRALVRLIGDLATFDLGIPDPRAFKPPRIVSFNAEQAVVQAIMKVTQGEGRPKLYFARGHGERDILGMEDPNDLGKLHTLLTGDGFDAERWSFVEDGPLPDDAAALAIIGPSDPYSDEELDAIERWVDGGGRLVVAPHPIAPDMERSRLSDLVGRYGMELSSGIVCQPFVDPTTGEAAVGGQQVALYYVAPDNMERHPITDPIKNAGRAFKVAGAHQVRVVRQPHDPRLAKGQGVTAPLFRSFPQAWIDSFDPQKKRYDYFIDQDTETFGRRFELAATCAFYPPGNEIVAELEARPEARVVVIGSADAFCDVLHDWNVDLMRNTFNWLVARDYRLSISPRDPDLRRLPPDRVPQVTMLVWLLPLLCLVLGVVTAFARSRGNPRRKAA